MFFSLSFLNHLYRIGLGLSLVLVVLDLIAFLWFPDTFFSRLFIATKEQAPLTWLSSITFLLLALATHATYHKTRKLYWAFLSVSFFFFSIDDAVYLHERIAGYFRDHMMVFQDFPSYIWMILYSPLLLASLGSLLILLWQRLTGTGRYWVAGIFLMLALAAGLDFLDGLIQHETILTFCETSRCQEIQLHFMRLLEELLEVWSIGALGYVVLREYTLLEGKPKTKTPA